jgi:hypothetical protein
VFFLAFLARIAVGTQLAFSTASSSRLWTSLFIKGLRSARLPIKEHAMSSRLFWAFLWVIGLPLPIVIILYMLFGGHS